MAKAILNKSQHIVPYNEGDLFRSAWGPTKMGLLEAAETASSPTVAFADPRGEGGLNEQYLPKDVRPEDVLTAVRAAQWKGGAVGNSAEAFENTFEYRVGYDIEYAVSVHEGLVHGKEVQNWTEGRGPYPDKKTSHFLANAFLEMEKRQGVLVRGVMKTVLQALRPRIEAEVAARAQAEITKKTTAAAGSLAPAGMPRLNKIKAVRL